MTDLKFPMERDQIMKVLPHRDPMLFIDRVISLEDGCLCAESDVKAEADVFKGHFPDKPILPGVLIIETTAQAGAILAGLTHDFAEGEVLALTSVDSVKFRRSVYPNETMRVEVKIVKSRRGFYKFEGAVYVGEELVAEPAFSAATVKL